MLKIIRDFSVNSNSALIAFPEEPTSDVMAAEADDKISVHGVIELDTVANIL